MQAGSSPFELDIDPALMKRYGEASCCAVYYPPADRFVEDFDATAHITWAARRNVGPFQRPLSLYVYTPFAPLARSYCAENQSLLSTADDARHYLQYLSRELDLQAPLFGSRPQLSRVYWAGDAPALLAPEDVATFTALVRRHFSFRRGAEWVLECDPSRLPDEAMARLVELGFTRAVWRVPAPPAGRASSSYTGPLARARTSGFAAVTTCLPFSRMPCSDVDFQGHLDQLVEAGPERIALVEACTRCRGVQDGGMVVHVDLLGQVVARLAEAGYVHVGGNTFTRLDDELAQAAWRGGLFHTPQGLAAQPEGDGLGLGVGNISTVGPTYSQNHRTLDHYYALLDQGHLPLERGLELSPDDLLRRTIIQTLLAHCELSMESVEIAHLIDFQRYFAPEIEQLKAFEAAGMLASDSQWITILPKGRALVRAIAAEFDRYRRSRPRPIRAS